MPGWLLVRLPRRRNQLKTDFYGQSARRLRSAGFFISVWELDDRAVKERSRPFPAASVGAFQPPPSQPPPLPPAWLKTTVPSCLRTSNTTTPSSCCRAANDAWACSLASSRHRRVSFQVHPACRTKSLRRPSLRCSGPPSAKLWAMSPGGSIADRSRQPCRDIEIMLLGEGRRGGVGAIGSSAGQADNQIRRQS